MCRYTCVPEAHGPVGIASRRDSRSAPRLQHHVYSKRVEPYRESEQQQVRADDEDHTR
jgi:hypothetical protein